MTGDADALTRLLGGQEMAWLRERVRSRILAADGEPLQGTVRLASPTEEERAGAWRLVGRPARRGVSVSIDLAVVEQILRRGPWPAGLADAVLTLTGPVTDGAAERAAEDRAWALAAEALTPAVSHLGVAVWWQQWCAAGGLKRAASAEAVRLGVARTPDVGRSLAQDLVGVLEQVPADSEPLAVLARRTTGSSHGLDSSRPLGRLAVAVLREAHAHRLTAESSTRDVWAAAGVVASTVLSTVLCLGVAGATSEEPRARATATALEAMREARLPVVLTLEQVRSGGIPPVPPEAGIHVCENPTVVEVIAARWVDDDGPARPVLVCTSGQPSTAAVELLRLLCADGAQVYYHGDFDWPGLRIAESLRARVPWQPWRFCAEDYIAAIGPAAIGSAAIGPPDTDRDGALALRGAPAASPWDPRLAEAMIANGVAVEEEAVAGILADDLLG